MDERIKVLKMASSILHSCLALEYHVMTTRRSCIILTPIDKESEYHLERVDYLCFPILRALKNIKREKMHLVFIIHFLSVQESGGLS